MSMLKMIAMTEMLSGIRWNATDGLDGCEPLTATLADDTIADGLDTPALTDGEEPPLNEQKTDDTLRAALGGDVLSGGFSGTSHTYAAGDGVRQITGFTGNDRLVLTGFDDINTFDDVLARATDNLTGTIIDLGGGDQILLADLERAELAAAQFDFTPETTNAEALEDVLDPAISATQTPAGVAAEDTVDGEAAADDEVFELTFPDATHVAEDDIFLSGEGVLVTNDTGSLVGGGTESPDVYVIPGDAQSTTIYDFKLGDSVQLHDMTGINAISQLNPKLTFGEDFLPELQIDMGGGRTLEVHYTSYQVIEFDFVFFENDEHVLPPGNVGDGVVIDTFAGTDIDEMHSGTDRDSMSGDDGNDTVTGSAGLDLLFGDAGDDTLDGGDQSDTLFGGDGDDQITGGAGLDFLQGGTGNDIITGSHFAEFLAGSAGRHHIISDRGQDTIMPGGGDDTIDVAGSRGELVIHRNSGIDIINDANLLNKIVLMGIPQIDNIHDLLTRAHRQ